MASLVSPAALERVVVQAGVTSNAARATQPTRPAPVRPVAEVDSVRPRRFSAVRAPRARVLGMAIDHVTETSLLGAVDQAVTARRATVFVGMYASLYRVLAQDDVYREHVAASVTYPDGQGVVSELHRRGVAEAERLATTDVVHPVTGLAAKRGWRVGLYGAAPGVVERAAEQLAVTAPGVQIVATWDGYSGGPSVAELRAARVDVLFVALGAARQEAWAHQTGVAAGVPAILTCGGLFDFLAGDKSRAPRWMQSAGLEWAYRVLLEPRRLFTRYLLGNSYFLRHARAERSSAPAVHQPARDRQVGTAINAPESFVRSGAA